MRIKLKRFLKQLLGINSTPANAFQDRIGQKDQPTEDRSQWNGGRHLTADELRKYRRSQEESHKE